MTQALLYLSIGLALVLLVRKPVRHAFGAGPAFTLWLLPLLLAGRPWLPAAAADWSIVPAVIVLPDASILGASGNAPDAATTRWLLLLWLAGSVFGLLRLALQYGRLLRQCRHLPEPMRQTLHKPFPNPRELQRMRLHPTGPAVLWAPRSLLLLPADFLTRFDADEQRLVLQHELTHLRRGDALWNLLAELAVVLLWFHPLVWLARPRFRLDQELACDERVLRQLPQEETRYASTLMHSVGTSPAPTLIPWLAEPQLKERLTMIQRHRPGTLRRRIGYLGLGLLMAGSALVAQAGTAHSPDQSAEADLAYNSKLQPTYPVAAIKNQEQGTVILLVQVHADGTTGSITYDPRHSTTSSADLIAAASTAARQWRFKPQMEGGKPIEGHARVPVKFRLKLLPGKTSRDEAEVLNSKT